MKRRSFLGGLLAALAVPIEALGRATNTYYVRLDQPPIEPYAAETGARNIFWNEAPGDFKYCFIGDVVLEKQDDGEWIELK